MPREIYNEGRVVGLSAYETYVKQHLSEDPNTPPATEREWLASSLAMGSSLLLKVPNVSQAEDAHTFLDIYLPANSKLAAANTIMASFFDGDASFNGNWATKVTDYGQLISNTSSSSPSENVGPTGNIPRQTLEDWTDAKKKQLADYMRVFDGVVIQPGNWVDNSSKPPQKDFKANLSNPYPRVRLHVRGPISNNPIILLTGFTIRSVLAGTVGQDTSINTQSPQDGDFLGPAVFPWAAKIVFSVPSSYITYFVSGGYKRALKSPTAEASSATSKMIRDTAVIDMQASKPETFYNNYSNYYSNYTSDSTNPRYGYTVEKFSTLGDPPKDGEAVLTVYQKKAIYPPALYGTFVGENGQHYLNPLDIVAPGSIKVFNEQNAQALKDYQDTFPGTTAMNKRADGTIQILDVNNEIVDVAALEIKYLYNKSGNMFSRLGQNAPSAPKLLKVKTGRKSAYALMMSTNISDNKNTDPTSITVTDKPSSTLVVNKTNANDNINWATLLGGLTEDKDIDLLGTRIKSAKYSLVENAGYLEFGPENNKTRLYISKTEPNPSNVPVGSIGIGWGFSDESAPPTPSPDPSGGVDYSAFGNISIDGTEISATQDGDTLTLVAGKNIKFTTDAANKKITVSYNRRYIFIGDSYGARGNSWIRRVVTKLGLSSNDYYMSAVDGTGFAAGGGSNKPFLKQLQEISVDKPSTITDIIVCGGWNDGRPSRGGGATLKTSIQEFITYAKSTYPNATVHIGMISWMDTVKIPRREGDSVTPTSLAPQWDLRKVLGIYRSCGMYGGSYIENSQYLMHNNSYFTSDGLHPNDDGNESIASGIVSYILGGNISVYNYDNADFTIGQGLTWNTTINHDDNWNPVNTSFYSLINNGKVGFIAANKYGLWLKTSGSTYSTIVCQGFYDPNSVGISGDSPTIITVGTFGNNCTFRGGDYNELSFRGSGYINSNGTWYTVPFLLTMLGPDRGANQSNKLALVFIETQGSFKRYTNVSDIWLNYPFIQMYGDAMFC